jgi:putative hydrolase of the HAD superfamily
MNHRNPRTLLLTLDAFGTVFHPRQPIPDQYAAAAHAFGLPRSTITPDRLKAAFKATFKRQSQTRPNYGREDVLRGKYGGPRQWWEEVIRGSFAQVLTSTSGSSSPGEGGSADAVPDALVSHLLDRFAGRQGYALFDDVGPFMAVVRAVKSRRRGLGPFERVLVGVISNSDDRVPAVLKALGLSVGDVRADQGVESMRLPGFEERGAGVGSVGKDAATSTIDDVDLVITSYEAGEEKPSRVIFDVARRQARRLLADEGESGDDLVSVHVGDDFDKDYRAALNAGWDGYYLPRGPIAEDTRGNKTIHSLMDLIPELEAYR